MLHMIDKSKYLIIRYINVIAAICAAVLLVSHKSYRLVWRLRKAAESCVIICKSTNIDSPMPADSSFRYISHNVCRLGCNNMKEHGRTVFLKQPT